MKKIVSMMLLAALALAGCERKETVVYQQAPAQPVVAPAVAAGPAYEYDEYRQPTDNRMLEGALIGAAATALIMGNGMHYDGYHWIGPAPRGYILYGGRLYRDTPYVRSYSRTHHVTVVKHVTVNKTVNVNKNVTVNKTTTPAATPAAATPAKVKNPGDAAAEAQKAQMQKQADLKAQLKAKQEARAAAKATPSKPSGGGFKAMSQKASSMSSPSRSGKK